MKNILLISALFLLNKSFAQEAIPTGKKYVLVIQGGAGTILKSQMTEAQEKAYFTALNLALDTGNAILARGGTALDAVEASVRLMEDNPLFNAGKGAVFTNEGRNELDAAIMKGKDLAAGAVAGVTRIRNPISAARAVMEKSPHVMMAGPGAEKFATEQGLEMVDPSYFHTESRWKSLERARQKDSLENEKIMKEAAGIQRRIDSLRIEMDKAVNKSDSIIRSVNADSVLKLNQKLEELRKNIQKQSVRVVAGVNHDDKFGTVGAVALDRYGNLAAATSTGGMTNKRYGRIGDAPIIGAGTYANNATAAISGTGWGEFFIRLAMAKTISDMMEFGKWSLQKASEEMVMKRLPKLGGDGGIIAVDKNGNIAMPFCTEGMYRGYIKYTGERKVEIYK